MIDITEIGEVFKLNDVLFVQYRTSPVLTDVNTFYLNKQNGNTTNFYTPSITQWHWNPIYKEDEQLLLDIVKNATEYKDVYNDDDMWLKEKMKDVMCIIR